MLHRLVTTPRFRSWVRRGRHPISQETPDLCFFFIGFGSNATYSDCRPARLRPSIPFVRRNAYDGINAHAAAFLRGQRQRSRPSLQKKTKHCTLRIYKHARSYFFSIVDNHHPRIISRLLRRDVPDVFAHRAKKTKTSTATWSPTVRSASGFLPPA